LETNIIIKIGRNIDNYREMTCRRHSYNSRSIDNEIKIDRETYDHDRRF